MDNESNPLKLHFFESIHVKIPHEEIYKRLGYRNGITKFPLEQREEFERYTNEAIALLSLKGVGLRVPIQGVTPQTVTISTGIFFRSRLLASLLKNCSEIVGMGVTAGEKIIQSIAESENTNLVRSVVLDAVASEMVDACFDWIQSYFFQELHRENKQLLSKRISCGYADFSIEYQKVMYDMLQLSRLGVSLTKTCMLVPEKSATSLTGVIIKHGA